MRKIKKAFKFNIALIFILVGSGVCQEFTYLVTINSSNNLRAPLVSNNNVNQDRQEELQRQVFLGKHGLSRFLTQEEALHYFHTAVLTYEKALDCLDTAAEVTSLNIEYASSKSSLKEWIESGWVLIAERLDGTKVVVSKYLLAKTKFPLISLDYLDIDELKKRIRAIKGRFMCFEYSAVLTEALRIAGDKAYVIKMHNGHHYVNSARFGDIDVYHEGHNLGEDLAGNKVSEIEYKDKLKQCSSFVGVHDILFVLKECMIIPDFPQRMDM